MTFLAGERLSADALNQLNAAVVLAADQTVNNTTTLTAASGLSFTLAGSATYIIDGWLRWTSNPTADIKVGWTIPAGADGWWTLFNPYISTSPAVAGRERVNYIDCSTISLQGSNALSSAGDDESTGTIDLAAIPRGYIVTGLGFGTLQLTFAQNTANASNTILGAGSWLSVRRVG